MVLKLATKADLPVIALSSLTAQAIPSVVMVTTAAATATVHWRHTVVMAKKMPPKLAMIKTPNLATVAPINAPSNKVTNVEHPVLPAHVFHAATANMIRVNNAMMATLWPAMAAITAVPKLASCVPTAHPLVPTDTAKTSAKNAIESACSMAIAS